MRKGSNPRLLFDGEKFMGVGLGADYCAEHEYGIRELQGAFGLNTEDTSWGIERRIIRRVPPGLQDFSLGRTWGFSYMHYGKLAEYINNELRGAGLRAAWSESDFAVVSDVTTAKKHLKTLYQEFQKKNGIICFIAGIGMLENAGLCLAIADRMPENVKNIWHDADEQRYVLAEMMKRSGIEELLAEKGKRYFALSPRKMPDGSIKFNLNPYDQENNNWGFFSLEELQQWAEGYGPVPKNPVKVS